MNPRPTTIFVHVGTNNIFGDPLREVRKCIRKTLVAIRNILPQVRIIWSEIIPRLFYYGEKSGGAGERSRIKLNRHARKVCLEDVQGYVIRNADLFPRWAYEYYRYDGVHLSVQGNFRFRQNLENGLLYLNVHKCRGI